MANKSIYVTMPTLAPLEEVTQLMQGIWERGIMTVSYTHLTLPTT